MKIKQNGSGFIFAVILMFVILGMVITLSSITVLETKMSQKTKSSVGAFFSADSGVEWALNKIANATGENISDAFSGFIGGKCPCPSGFNCDIYFLDDQGKVIIANGALENVKAVRSVGTNQAGDPTQRAIEAAVADTTSCWCPPEDVKATSASHDGNFGGYVEAYNWIQANGCAGYHICDQVELSRYAQLHGGDSIPRGFYQVGMGSSASSGNISDCAGWTYNNMNNGTSWDPAVGYGYLEQCYNTLPMLCCQ
jgi:hypothetical protein